MVKYFENYLFYYNNELIYIQINIRSLMFKQKLVIKSKRERVKIIL